MQSYVKPPAGHYKMACTCKSRIKEMLGRSLWQQDKCSTIM